MEIPEAMINTQVRQMYDDMAQRIQMQGLTMEQYFQFTGLTSEKMLEEMKEEYNKIATIVGIVSETGGISSFRSGDKTFYSYFE